jgi:hypothetical protein
MGTNSRPTVPVAPALTKVIADKVSNLFEVAVKRATLEPGPWRGHVGMPPRHCRILLVRRRVRSHAPRSGRRRRIV